MIAVTLSWSQHSWHFDLCRNTIPTGHANFMNTGWQWEPLGEGPCFASSWPVVRPWLWCHTASTRVKTCSFRDRVYLFCTHFHGHLLWRALSLPIPSAPGTWTWWVVPQKSTEFGAGAHFPHASLWFATTCASNTDTRYFSGFYHLKWYKSQSRFLEEDSETNICSVEDLLNLSGGDILHHVCFMM